MTSYVFVFGSTPELSHLELSSLFPYAHQISTALGEVSQAGFTIDGKVQTPNELIGQMGGTVKIAESIRSISSPEALGDIVEILRESAADGRITFGISVYGKGNIQREHLEEIKQRLSAYGIRARFIEPKEGQTLGSVVVEKTSMVEIILYEKDGIWRAGRTMAVQPFEKWIFRDRQRPQSDAKSGMLPLKVARMIVNIGFGGKAGEKIVLDPFCGTGSILMEALLSGAICFGSDIKREILLKTEANLAWVKETYHLHPSFTLIHCDASHVSEHVPNNSIDAIITEPFLGTARLGEGKITKIQKIQNILKGLEKMFIGCFRDWHHVLKPKGKVVIAIPSYVIGGVHYSVKNIIDMCENLGYTKRQGPIAYSRPQAVVTRQFYVFEKIS